MFVVRGNAVKTIFVHINNDLWALMLNMECLSRTHSRALYAVSLHTLEQSDFTSADKILKKCWFSVPKDIPVRR